MSDDMFASLLFVGGIGLALLIWTISKDKFLKRWTPIWRSEEKAETFGIGLSVGIAYLFVFLIYFVSV